MQFLRTIEADVPAVLNSHQAMDNYDYPPCCLTKECYPSACCRLSSFFINFRVEGGGHVVEGCGGGQRSRAAARYRP